MFFANLNKKNEKPNPNLMDSDTYGKLLNRILEGDSRIAKIEGDLRVIRTDLENLRGNFNRKLSGLAKEEEKKENPQQTESFNNSFDVPFG